MAFLGAPIIFSIKFSSFEFHDVKLPWLYRLYWVAPIHPTSIHWVITLGAMLESYHKLQPKSKTVSEFEDALQLIWSALSEKPLTTLLKTSSSVCRHVCQPTVNMLNIKWDNYRY